MSVESYFQGIRTDVTKELVSLFEERRSIGLQEYGQPMQPFIGEPAMKHELEEVLDQCVYAMAQYLEYQAMWKVLDDITITLKNGTDEQRRDAYESYLYLKGKMGLL